MGGVKTTLEIPDFLFRRAKAVAAERGIPLRQFVTEAVQDKLKLSSQAKPWMKDLGRLTHVRKKESRSRSASKKRSSGLTGKFGNDPRYECAVRDSGQ
jgi:hypothetical protein